MKQLVKQISTGKIEFIRGEFGAAARQVSIGLRLLVQPAPHNLLDIRLLWDAVDTFFNQPDLKRAFESVFDWFFDFQEIVGAPNLYFLCGAGLAPRSDPGSLIQL
ncbi:MAG TPA: hypothetical protein VEZ90_07290 [Blastocatellia bacterium]|nr:hypothetical protein [Blastocatellia bacterium]